MDFLAQLLVNRTYQPKDAKDHARCALVHGGLDSDTQQTVEVLAEGFHKRVYP